MENYKNFQTRAARHCSAMQHNDGAFGEITKITRLRSCGKIKSKKQKDKGGETLQRTVIHSATHTATRTATHTTFGKTRKWQDYAVVEILNDRDKNYKTRAVKLRSALQVWGVFG